MDPKGEYIPSFLYFLPISVCVCVCVQSLSHVWLFATPWAVACQAPLSMGFFRQEYWSRLPFPTPRDLPDPWIKHASPASPALQADSLPLSHLRSPFLLHLGHHRALVFPVLYRRFSLVIYFIHRVNNVYMSIPISQFIPPLFPCLVSIHLFSISVSLFLLCAGKDWGQEEKGAAEDEMVRCHWLNGHEFEQTPADCEGQGSLEYCSSGGCRVGHNLATEKQQHINFFRFCIYALISLHFQYK